MKKFANSLLLALTLVTPLVMPAVQATPEDKAVGKAATIYRYLDIAAGRSKNSMNERVAQNLKKPGTETQIAVQTQVQPAATMDAQYELSKAESPQANTAK